MLHFFWKLLWTCKLDSPDSRWIPVKGWWNLCSVNTGNFLTTWTTTTLQEKLEISHCSTGQSTPILSWNPKGNYPAFSKTRQTSWIQTRSGNPTVLKPNIVLFCHLYLDFTNSIFPSVLLTKVIHVFLNFMCFSDENITKKQSTFSEF